VTGPAAAAGRAADAPPGNHHCRMIPAPAGRCDHGRILGGDLVTRQTYEIRVIGSLGPAAREAFADMLVEVEPTITVLSGDFDQPGLHELLDRVRALGLELVDVKQTPT
jgi:hypothetical protein